MFILTFLVCLCSNFLFIYSDAIDNEPVIIEIVRNSNCKMRPVLQFSEGQNITLVVDKKRIQTIDHGWMRKVDSNPLREYNLTQSLSIIADKHMEGVWEYKFLYFKVQFDQRPDAVRFENNMYTQSVCRSKIKIVSTEGESSGRGFAGMEYSNRVLYIVIGVAVLAVVIILAQTACILTLKAKAKALHMHHNLSKKTEPIEPIEPDVRYCSNPRPKAQKVAPIKDIERESVIYEKPNVGLRDETPIGPPQPPEINTIPRKPWHDKGITVGGGAAQPAILAAVMNNAARSPNSHHSTFPRPIRTERDNVTNRPPLPLPSDEDMVEDYEDVEQPEENLYEPPPIVNTMPARSAAPHHKVLPTLATKVPIGLNLELQAETMKLRAPEKRLPLTKPKTQTQPQTRPRPNHMAQANELEEAFRRRNNGNATPIPILTIPDPSKTSGPSRKPKPAVMFKPKGSPVPQAVHNDPYSNDRRSSSDDEWTYEPLKPMHNYTMY